MKITLAFLASAITFASAISVPHQLLKRQADTSGLTDADVLNFALQLEHLEDTFYKQGLSNYTDKDFSSASGLGSLIRPNVQEIAKDEASHVALLTGALSAAGATPAQACTYKFPATDAHGFLGLAQVLEGVGVSAYIGAAQYISSPAYLEVAASILTVEARHNAFIRLANGYSPFPSPYDTGLSPKAVVSLAGSFFASCPDGSAPAFTPFPAATVTSTNYTLGSTLTVTANTTMAGNNTSLYCGFASGVQAAFSPYTNGSCVLPSQNVTGGQVYGFVLTAQNISDASTVAGPFILNVDSQNNTLSGSSASSAKQNAVESSAATSVAAKFGSAALAMVGAVAVLL